MDGGRRIIRDGAVAPSTEAVIVDGSVVKEEGAVTTVDADLCLAQAQELCEEVWSAFFRAHPELGKPVR